MPETANEREALKNRQLPEMTLSNAFTEDSLTKPTQPFPESMSTQERIMRRFAVEGNAIITGGCGTLALEAARALLEHGVTGLALFDLKPDQATLAVDRLRSAFPSAKIITQQVNVTDADNVNAATADTVKQLGPIDTLCCFAGVVGCTPAADMPAAEWRRTLDTNTTSAFLCAQAVANHSMIPSRRGGSIVFIASISAHRVNFPQPQVAYNVSKSALIHLAHSLAAEWAGSGVRVNTLSPGYMDTILNEGAGLEKARKVWQDRNPMGRMGSPSELTGPLVLLCSRYGGAYITGTDLCVDGGQCVF